MALTGTASIGGSNERVYAAYVDKATGVITEFKVYDVELFGNNMHSIAGDICLQATNKLALVFTTFNDTYRSEPGTQNETDIAFVVGGKVDRPS